MTTMTISNLPGDLVSEILSRVLLKYMRAFRLTCKSWNDLSKTLSFTKLHIGKALAAGKEGESQMIVLMDNNIYLTSIVLNGDPSTEHEAKLTCLDTQVKISEIFLCEGLLLCIFKNDDSRFVVWNPYLGQPRWIEPRYSNRPYGWHSFSYALGYVNKESCRSYKLLRFMDYSYNAPEYQFFSYEIYDLDSVLWTTLDVTPHWRIAFSSRGVSLKGNTYWCAAERNSDYKELRVLADHIIRFDFTSERFVRLMPMPFSVGFYDYMVLSCVREEKLAVLLQDAVNFHQIDLWITTKIETEELLWSKFFIIETAFNIFVPFINRNFFIDEEKRVAIGFDNENHHKVDIIGEDGYFRALDLVGETEDLYSGSSNLWSYVPSLVLIKQPKGGGRKQDSDLEKRHQMR